MRSILGFLVTGSFRAILDNNMILIDSIDIDSMSKKLRNHILTKVKIFLEQREVAILSPSKICKNLNSSTEIQIFTNFVG